MRATPSVPGNGRSGRTMPGRNSVCHVVEIEIQIFDLAVLIDVRELAEHAGHVEVRRIGARNDLVEPDLEHVARLRFLDIDRPRQGVRPATGEIGAQLLDLLDGGAWHHLIVAVHHRFQHDGVTGIARAAPAAAHCRTSPIAWFRASPAAHAPSCRSAYHNAELGIGRPDGGIGDGRGRRELRRSSRRAGRGSEHCATSANRDLAKKVYVTHDIPRFSCRLRRL